MKDTIFMWVALAGWLALTWPRRSDSFVRIAVRIASAAAVMLGAAFVASMLPR